MAALTTGERRALRSMRNGEHLPQAAFDQLLNKKLVSHSPVALTQAGRIVCELLEELDHFKRDDDSATRGEY